MNEDLGKEEVVGRRRAGGRAVLWRKKEREEDENTCIPTNMHSLALSNIYSVTTGIENSLALRIKRTLHSEISASA